ncbi:hypothetical protein GmHk_03G007414 [Glycine max]|nr:hypothetical protein GmHk_03G007414 [Glycine max]
METIGGCFTWRKNIHQDGHVRKKLDRCLANPTWQVHFPHGLAKLLNPFGSNHNLIMVHCYKSPTWKTHPEFQDLVSQTWSNTLGNAINKLDRVKEKKKRELEARIKGVHKILCTIVTSDMIQLEKTL